VSLYQVLPRKWTRERRHKLEPNNSETSGQNWRNKDNNSGPNGQNLEEEHPLRLLDIRRIDLHSTGWETFYVKRAVEDWLRDESTNLGEFLSRFRASKCC